MMSSLSVKSVQMTKVFSILFVLLFGPSVWAQFREGPGNGMPSDVENVVAAVARFQHLRELGALDNFQKMQNSSFDAELKALAAEAAASDRYSVQNPAVENPQTFANELSEMLANCPAEITAAVSAKKVDKEVRFPDSMDAKATARCTRGFDSLYLGLTHWNRIRFLAHTYQTKAEEKADVRLYFSALEDATADHLKTACKTLTDFIMPLKSAIDCNDAITIEQLKGMYQSGFGVLKTNPAIHAVKEGDQVVLELWASANDEDLKWMQEVLDRSWNQIDGSDIRIRLVDHKNKDNALHLMKAAPGQIPSTYGLASNLIYLDRSPNVEMILIHEFGHILGFRDCYVQLWDEGTRSTTYYELDKSNIMCSFSGKPTRLHTSELKRVYSTVESTVESAVESAVDLTPSNDGQ